MKKILTLIMLFTFILSLASCNHEHKFNEWVIEQESTCSEEGIMKRTCSKCDFFESKTIAKKNHTLVVDEAVEATCTKNGLTEGKHCSVCNYVSVKQQTIMASHSYKSEITTSATCEGKGIRTYTCSKCNDSYTENISATGHNYTSKVTKSATCESSGIKTYTCSKCNDSYTENIKATGHSYSSSATCTEGVKCTTCGKSTGQPLGHTTNFGLCTRCYKEVGPTLTLTNKLNSTFNCYNSSGYKISAAELTTFNYTSQGRIMYATGEIFFRLIVKVKFKITYVREINATYRVNYYFSSPSGEIIEADNLIQLSTRVGLTFEDSFYIDVYEPGNYTITFEYFEY